MAQLVIIHAGLANTAALFVAALGIWALIQRVRSQPLSGSWFGAAMIGELILVAQALVGATLYFQGLGAALPRPFIHILYGIVAIITLPAAQAYFGGLDDENVTTMAMAVTCLFLWGIIVRATTVAQYLPTGY
jgi:hypothetical protein